MVIWYLIDRACFSAISEVSRSETVGHFQRQVGIEPSLHVDIGQFAALEVRIVVQLFPLPRHIRALGV
jgi:hypothetical protein